MADSFDSRSATDRWLTEHPFVYAVVAVAILGFFVWLIVVGSRPVDGRSGPLVFAPTTFDGSTPAGAVRNALLEGDPFLALVSNDLSDEELDALGATVCDGLATTDDEAELEAAVGIEPPRLAINHRALASGAMDDIARAYCSRWEARAVDYLD